MVTTARKVNQKLNMIDKKNKRSKRQQKCSNNKGTKHGDSYRTKYGIQEDKDQKKHDQEIMNIFYFGSLMQEHSTQGKSL